MDFVFLEEPVIPVTLEECSQSQDFSVIGDEPSTSSTPVSAVKTSLVDMENDHFNYYPVTYRSWSIRTCLVQLAVFSCFGVFFNAAHGLMLTYVLDGFLNILVYVGKYHWKSIDRYFYTEPVSVKFVYFLLINLPVCLALYALHYIAPAQWIAYLVYANADNTLGGTRSDPTSEIVLVLINLPCFVNWVVNHRLFRKYYYLVIQEIHFVARSLICKRVSHAINAVSIKYLGSDPNISSRELMQLLPNIHIQQLFGFICASAIATILLYFELDGIKFYTALVRQYYFREYLDFTTRRQRKLNNQEYICDIIVKREWHQFTDPYTLNRLLKLYLEINSRQNGGLFYSETSLSDRSCYWLTRVATSISINSVFSPKLVPIIYLVDTIKDLLISRQRRKHRQKQDQSRKYEITVCLAGGDAEGDFIVSETTKYTLASYWWILIIRCAVVCLYYVLLVMSSEVILLIIGLELGFVTLGNIFFCKLVISLVNIISWRWHDMGERPSPKTPSWGNAPPVSPRLGERPPLPKPPPP